MCIQGAINPGLAGLCLVYSLDLTRYLKFGTQMASKAESDFNSAERVVQFLEPEQEAADDTPPEVEKVTVGWPSSGAITGEAQGAVLAGRSFEDFTRLVWREGWSGSLLYAIGEELCWCLYVRAGAGAVSGDDLATGTLQIFVQGDGNPAC